MDEVLDSIDPMVALKLFELKKRKSLNLALYFAAYNLIQF
jgi:hypothetical protein